MLLTAPWTISDTAPPTSDQTRRLLYFANEDFAFLLNRLPMARAARALPYFLQDNWDLQHTSHVPIEAVRKATKRIGGVARNRCRH